jgi:hypothetical protein
VHVVQTQQGPQHTVTAHPPASYRERSPSRPACGQRAPSCQAADRCPGGGCVNAMRKGSSSREGGRQAGGRGSGGWREGVASPGAQRNGCGRQSQLLLPPPPVQTAHLPRLAPQHVAHGCGGRSCCCAAESLICPTRSCSLLLVVGSESAVRDVLGREASSNVAIATHVATSKSNSIARQPSHTTPPTLHVRQP